jgi:hypothetical protein
MKQKKKKSSYFTHPKIERHSSLPIVIKLVKFGDCKFNDIIVFAEGRFLPSPIIDNASCIPVPALPRCMQVYTL